ncbi:MAG TPA: phage Gp37/Gp68 family protein [Solirubrobacterales bacterium]
MADHGTAIEWTQAPGFKGETWNPVTGCDRVSPGCAHCYALELAGRLKRMGQYRYQRDGDPKTSGPGFGVTIHSDRLGEPQRWRKPRMVFVNSMSDLFHDEISDFFIAEVFAVMSIAEVHIFQVLTKRPERMRDLLSDAGFLGRVDRARAVRGYCEPTVWPIPNVWLGVTIENRRFVHRADLLRETPAAVRFISAEPLLGPLVYPTDLGTFHEGQPDGHELGGDPYEPCWEDGSTEPADLDLEGIDWLITGGESGPNHRRFDPQWALDLQFRCQIESTAFFHKQNGGRTPKAGGRELDGRTWSEFPAALSTSQRAA